MSGKRKRGSRDENDRELDTYQSRDMRDRARKARAWGDRHPNVTEYFLDDLRTRRKSALLFPLRPAGKKPAQSAALQHGGRGFVWSKAPGRWEGFFSSKPAEQVQAFGELEDAFSPTIDPHAGCRSTLGWEQGMSEAHHEAATRLLHETNREDAQVYGAICSCHLAEVEDDKGWLHAAIHLIDNGLTKLARHYAINAVVRALTRDRKERLPRPARFQGFWRLGLAAMIREASSPRSAEDTFVYWGLSEVLSFHHCWHKWPDLVAAANLFQSKLHPQCRHNCRCLNLKEGLTCTASSVRAESICEWAHVCLNAMDTSSGARLRCRVDLPIKGLSSSDRRLEAATASVHFAVRMLRRTIQKYNAASASRYRGWDMTHEPVQMLTRIFQDRHFTQPLLAALQGGKREAREAAACVEDAALVMPRPAMPKKGGGPTSPSGHYGDGDEAQHKFDVVLVLEGLGVSIRASRLGLGSASPYFDGLLR